MDEAETKSPSPNGKGLLRAPIVCNRWRTAGLLRLAQEADSNRDCLDSFIVAEKGRRIGGLFHGSISLVSVSQKQDLTDLGV